MTSFAGSFCAVSGVFLEGFVTLDCFSLSGPPAFPILSNLQGGHGLQPGQGNNRHNCNFLKDFFY